MQNLAQTMMRLVLLTMLMSFRLEVAAVMGDAQQVVDAEVMKLVLTCKGGVRLVCRAR